MELVSREMPADYTLIDTGDWHLGPLNHCRSALREIVKEVVKNKDTYLWGKGDMIDAITPDDKRFSFASIEVREGYLTPHEHTDELIDELRPAAETGRVLGWQLGNHEYKLLNSFNVAGYVCRALNLPFGGVAAKFIALKDGRPVHKMFFTHGNGSIRSRAKDPIQALANKKALLKDKLIQTGHTDCIYMSMGHCHALLVVEPTTGRELMLTDDGERLHQSRRADVPQTSNYIPREARWYGASGSLLKCYTEPGTGAISYSEAAMYGPADIGYLKVRVENHKVVAVEEAYL